MWGQVVQVDYHAGGYRIIPTRVGTSCKGFAATRFKEDHPHACGDKRGRWGTKVPSIGSSPRVWGQGSTHLDGILLIRIIPTHVGTSINDSLRRRDFWDHPHACGDKQTAKLFCRLRAGSSPRVWGQAPTGDFTVHDGRIIPTRVGTSPH